MYVVPCSPLENSSLLSRNVALVNGPRFSSSDLGSLDLVIFYCRTFPWGAGTQDRRWAATSETHQVTPLRD